MRSHDQSVHDQFDSRAEAYLTSAVHAQGPDLRYAQELLARAGFDAAEAIDVGCGAGHLSFALAAAVKRIVAVDPTHGMLEVVAKEAAARRLPQITTLRASAESLPIDAASVDLVATRYSAHHWTGFAAAMREIHRVLRPGGYFLISDVLGDESPLVDTHLQAIELLRDPSHVRDYSKAEWETALAHAGFVVEEFRQWATRIGFALWVERMRTPADRVAVIRGLQVGAPREVQDALGFEGDGSFNLQTGLFWARKG